MKLVKVKDKYPHFSESLMYEWTFEKPTMFNRFKIKAYAYWQSIKNEYYGVISLTDQIMIDKIQDLHDAALGARRGTIAYKRQRR